MLLMMMMMIMMQMETGGADQTRARLLISGVAEANVTFAKTGSLSTVRQGGWGLRRWCLCLCLLLLLWMRMMRMLILCMLRILDRWRCHRLMHSDSTTLLVQSAAMKIALANGAAISTVHRAAVSRDRLMDVVGALRCVNVNGRAVERIRALLH